MSLIPYLALHLLRALFTKRICPAYTLHRIGGYHNGKVGAYTETHQSISRRTKAGRTGIP